MLGPQFGKRLGPAISMEPGAFCKDARGLDLRSYSGFSTLLHPETPDVSMCARTARMHATRCRLYSRRLIALATKRRKVDHNHTGSGTAT